MWLLHSSTYELKEFFGENIPRYAILSHVWDGEDVSFRDVRKDLEAAKHKAGFSKIRDCCAQAKKDSLEWVWIDSCCIDKRSSAELSEAINSMFKWYRRARICYAFLADVFDVGYNAAPDLTDQFSKSRWFTRGWTLQELIAPRRIRFFSNSWKLIGAKSSMKKHSEFVDKISVITKIGFQFLTGGRLEMASVAERMSWASSRQTTREEDIAYSLMGLFDVNMPVLYGEGGEKAFERLQIETMGTIADHSIFAWRANSAYETGPLAISPADFAHGGAITVSAEDSSDIRPFSLTNAGLEINLPISMPSGQFGTQVIARLNCSFRPLTGEKRQPLGIHLAIISDPWTTSVPSCRRRKCDELVTLDSNSSTWKRADVMILTDVHMRHRKEICGQRRADRISVVE